MSGVMQQKYPLDSANQQKRLFSEYLKIKSVDDVHAWCGEYGLPGCFSDGQSDQVGNRVIKSWRIQPVTEILESVACLRHLRHMMLALQASKLDYKHDNLKALFIHEGLFEDDGLVISQPRKVFRSNGLRLESVELSEPDVVESNCSVKEMRQAIKARLLRCINVMLESIPVEMQWVADKYDGPVLRQRFSIKCPWHCIVIQLIQLFKGDRRVVICPHPNCGKPLDNKRSNAQSCGSDACVKWVQRHPELMLALEH